jgi:hypothetical protein
MLRQYRVFTLVILSAAPLFAAAQEDAMSVLSAAAKAMHLEQVKTIRYTATGSAFAIGQSYVAGGAYPRLSLKFSRDFDLDGFTARQELVNTRVDKRGGFDASRPIENSVAPMWHDTYFAIFIVKNVISFPFAIRN